MTQLFFNQSNAFYRSVKHVSIQAINDDSWTEYIRGGFVQYDKEISPEQIREILHRDPDGT